MLAQRNQYMERQQFFGEREIEEGFSDLEDSDEVQGESDEEDHDTGDEL